MFKDSECNSHHGIISIITIYVNMSYGYDLMMLVGDNYYDIHHNSNKLLNNL